MKNILALIFACLLLTSYAHAQDELGDGEFAGNTLPDGIFLNAETNQSVLAGTNQPSVAYFPTSWKNYTYWMAAVSGTTANISASNDGISWEVPPAYTPVDSSSLYSRVCLMYDNTSDELWLYATKNDEVIRKNSTDGLTWSAETAVTNSDYEDFISVEHIGTNYVMWQNLPVQGADKVNVSTSTDGLTFGAPSRVNLTFFNTSSYGPISMDVEYSDPEYKMTIVAWDYDDDAVIDYRYKIFYANSTDGVNWNVHNDTALLSAHPPYWDEYLLYGASMVYTDNEVKLWYSALGREYDTFSSISPGIGHTTMNRTDFDNAMVQ